MNDDEWFRRHFADVKPLKQDKAELDKKPGRAFDYNLRRLAAADNATEHNGLSDPLESIAPHDIVSFVRPGIQQGVFKKLRLGKYEIHARLDLHGMTVDKARSEIRRFIDDCIRYELRVVMIVHGKSDRKTAEKAILKSHTVHWLQQFDAVMAFHSAQPQHGGAGAVYVLLKKSDSAKQKNREKYGGR